MKFYLKIAKYYLMSAVWGPAGCLVRAAGPVRRPEVENAKVRKIAVLRTGAIGDVVMTTPFLRRLRELFPNAGITYYTFAPNQPLLRHNPHIDRIGAMVHLRAGGGSRGEKRGFLEVFRGEGYDAAFFLDTGGPHTHWPGWFARVPVRVGFDDCGRGFLLTHRVRKGWDSPGHMVDWYLELLDFFGGGGGDPRMEVHWSGEDEKVVGEFLEESGVGEGDLLVAVFPGGGENPGATYHAKRWPGGNFARVAEKIGSEWGAKVVVVGDESDVEASAPVLESEECKPVNAVGKFALTQTAALLGRCDMFIGNDSAPLHIAAAAGTPTVGIFGPTRPERLAPRGEGHVVVVSGRRCAPCYREVIGAARECGGCECMEEIAVEQVLEAAAENLRRVNPGKLRGIEIP